MMCTFPAIVKRQVYFSIYFLCFGFPLFYSNASIAQAGCTDPNASNYNAAATSNNGTCTYPAITLALTSQKDLPASLNEGSALMYTDGNLWTLNDGTNPAAIYRIDPGTGGILQTVNISNATNIDWEDLAADANYIYIGDFGNNQNGNRTTLRIIRIAKADITAANPLTVTGTIIPFSYADQVIENPVTTGSNATAFDCEAFFVQNGTFHLFTKDWVAGKTKHYTMPATTGTQVATMVEEYDVDGLITGADISADGGIALVGYSSDLLSLFMYLLGDYSSGNYFNGNKRKINLGNSFTKGQLEGVTFTTGLSGYVSSEQVSPPFLPAVPPRLYSFDASNLVALPVKLVDFKLSQSNGQVQAKWSTSSETNSEYFVLERSSDAQSFIELGRVTAAGNSSVAKSYSYTDPDPVEGMNYYRLKQVDSDGNVSIYGIRSINIMAYSGNMIIYPSPAIGNTVTFDYGKEVPAGMKYQLVNQAGAILGSGSIHQRKQTITITGLPHGQYFFRLSNGLTATFIKY